MQITNLKELNREIRKAFDREMNDDHLTFEERYEIVRASHVHRNIPFSMTGMRDEKTLNEMYIEVLF